MCPPHEAWASHNMTLDPKQVHPKQTIPRASIPGESARSCMAFYNLASEDTYMVSLPSECCKIPKGRENRP